MPRKNMKKPTKLQISSRLQHFESHVAELISQLQKGTLSLENVFPYLELATKSAPSLEPVTKAAAEVAEANEAAE